MASLSYFLGIDQGTQSTKAVLFDQNGVEIASSSRPVKMDHSSCGLITQAPDEIFLSVIEAIKDVVQESRVSPKDIAALAIDSQICSLATIDEMWQPVTPIISHLDISSNKIRDQILEEMGDRIFIQNGSLPYIASRLLWIKQEQPEKYKKIYRVMLVSAYCSGKLCGLPAEEAYVDHTTMNVFGWGNLSSKSWDKDLADQLNIEFRVSPIIRAPLEIIGGLDKKWAEQCGLYSGTPVLAGVGDAIAGWMGVGADRPGLVVDTSGSANHLCFCVDHFKPDISKRILGYYPSISEHLGYQIGFTAGTGKSHRWFVDLLNSNLKNKFDQCPSVGISFEELDIATQKIPPLSDGVIFIPHFGGRVCPLQPKMRGGWLGLRWDHDEAHLYRSILESIAFEYDFYMRRAREIYPEYRVEDYYVIGGGSKSSVWAQIKADVLGVPVKVLTGATDFAARGSAMLAAKVMGYKHSFLPSRYIQEAEEYFPDEKNHEKYSNFSGKYGRILEQLKNVYQELILDYE